jgi:hypothetical protein
MSDPTRGNTPDDDMLRRLGVRHVVERAADGTVTPRALGGEPADAPTPDALGAAGIKPCTDCMEKKKAKWLREWCRSEGFPRGYHVITVVGPKQYCYCACGK